MLRPGSATQYVGDGMDASTLARMATFHDAAGESDSTSEAPPRVRYAGARLEALQARRLAQTLFDRIEAVQESATRWLWTYNNKQPNMALRGITPSMKLALAA